MQSNLLRIGICGATGRMGRELIECLRNSTEMTLGAAIVTKEDSLLNTEVGLGRIKYSLVTAPNVLSCDAFLDFSAPSGTMALLEQLLENPRPFVIGTTGHDVNQMRAIQVGSEVLPVLKASNTSFGVAVLKELTRITSSLLGPEYEVEIIESHHRAKVDAPSGTALSLAHTVQAERGGELILDRANRGRKPRESSEIGIVSLRGGGVIGEHTVQFLGRDERIEIAHKADSRRLFARGALMLLAKLIGKKPGLYTPEQLLIEG